jgi:hypothetical protein
LISESTFQPLLFPSNSTLLAIMLYVLVYHLASSSAPASPSSSHRKISSCQRLFLFLDGEQVASNRAFRDWLRCMKPSPSRSAHLWDSFLLLFAMLVI